MQQLAQKQIQQLAHAYSSWHNSTRARALSHTNETQQQQEKKKEEEEEEEHDRKK